MKYDRTRVLARPRVNRSLGQICAYPLTVVRASMGFGKTTAVREYLRLRKLRPVFLSLVGSGGSLEYCWERLAAQVSRRSPALGRQLGGLGFPQDPAQTARMVELISGAELPDPTVVVLDDYHLVDGPRAAALLALLAGEEIPNLHIVLIARDTPHLPVSDLEQRGLCCVVDQEILRFRPQEVREYFGLMDQNVDDQTLEAVCTATGGWITGIYLVLRGIAQGFPPSRWSDTVDQLMDQNLYAGYDAPTRKFLQRLACLDSFTPEELAYVLEDRDAPDRLCALLRSNAFLTYDRGQDAYQMTDLFRDFLQGKAWREALEVAPIYRRAGEWHLSRGERTAAYSYLYRAGDVDAVLRDLNREEAQDIHIAQSPQIRMIFSGLPAETALNYPLAYLRYLRVEALWGEISRPRLQQKLSDMERRFLDADLSEDQRTRILGEIHNTWIFEAFNDAPAVVYHAARAVEYFAGRYSVVVSNRTEFTFGSPELLYCYYKEAGRLRETAELISQKFNFLALAANGCGSGSQDLALAEYALETGDFDQVALGARRAVYCARTRDQVAIELCAAFTLARLALMEGRAGEARRLLEELGQAVDRRNSAILNTAMVVCSAYLSTCLGRLEEIPRWLRENDMGPGNFMFQGMAFNYIVCARAALLAEDFVRLDVLCESFQRRFDIYSNQLGYIHNHICRAVARERLYGREEGLRHLRPALDIGAADGVIMPFAETARYLLPLLETAGKEGRWPAAYMERLLACCRRYASALEAGERPPVVLTDREREILRLLAGGATHGQISEALYVSVPTVRFHVKNLYQKLEVNNKVLALEKAKRLGLME